MTNAALPTLLICQDCDRHFDSDHQPVEFDGIQAGHDTAVFICPGCRIEHRREMARRRLRASGLPAGLQGLELPPGTTPIERDARRWADGHIPGLLLYGPVGAGKTHLAAAAFGRRLEREPATWASVPAMIARALAAFDSDDRRRALGELTGTGTLALDDLDKVKPSDWVLSQLFVAIDSRIQAGAGLIVTTNLSPSDIRDQLGEAIASRLMGYCERHRLNGRDRRTSR